MSKCITFSAIIFVFLFSANIYSQIPTALDRYLSESQTILIAKCTFKGPVKASLTGDLTIQILHIVKGKERIGEITFNSHYALEPGKHYLIRSTEEPTPNGRYLDLKSSNSAIQIPDYEDFELLRTLSPRIIVLRTMNARAFVLEDKIRRAQHELDGLNEIRIGQ